MRHQIARLSEISTPPLSCKHGHFHGFFLLPELFSEFHGNPDGICEPL
jgi:hypothetical protein